MITAQELRDMGNTLSWEDYTIGTIEQRVKAQQDRSRHGRSSSIQVEERTM